MSYTKHHLTHQFYPVSFCYSWDSFSGISLYRLAKNSNKLQWLSKQIEQYVTRLLHIVKFQTKWSETRSVVSDSVRPHGLQLTRLLCPWNSPGKNTGVGSHPFHQGTLPNPGIKSGSPALRAVSLPSEPLGKPQSLGCLLWGHPTRLKTCPLPTLLARSRVKAWRLRPIFRSKSL